MSNNNKNNPENPEDHWISKLICEDDSNCELGILKIFIPHICAIQDEKIINKKLALTHDFKFKINETEDKKELISFLEEYRQREINRKDVIEDKAKSSLFVITLSITFLTGVLKIIGEINIISLIYIIIGLSYFVLSGITAVEAIIPKPYYDIYFGDKFETKVLKDHKIKIKINKEQEIQALYKNVILNEFVIMKKTNYTDATFRGIVLGTFFISASLMLLLFN